MIRGGARRHTRRGGAPLGLLCALEALLHGIIVRRWPALAGASLDGRHAASLDFYRQPAPLLRGAGLHPLAWMLGSIETWAVLNALGTPAMLLQAFTFESLGMAVRSAGIVIPAAPGAQEGGFALAAVALGLPAGPALALSLARRRGMIPAAPAGLAPWRLAVR